MQFFIFKKEIKFNIKFFPHNYTLSSSNNLKKKEFMLFQLIIIKETFDNYKFFVYMKI